MKRQKIKDRISNKKIERFGDYFKKSLKVIFKNNVDNYLSAYLKEHWEDIVGGPIAKNAFLVSANDDALSLYVWHPAWINEIKNYQEDIISKVNAYAGKNMVKTIKFLSYPPQKNNKKNLKNNHEKTFENEIKLDDLTNTEEEEIKKSVSEVKDEDLRNILQKYRVISVKKQNYKRDNFIKCKICGKYQGEEICPDCRLRREEKIRKNVVEILTDAPFLSYSDIVKEIPDLDPDFFLKIRFEMVQRLAKKISLRDWQSLEAKTLTMLFTSTPPNLINDNIVKKH